MNKKIKALLFIFISFSFLLIISTVLSMLIEKPEQNSKSVAFIAQEWALDNERRNFERESVVPFAFHLNKGLFKLHRNNEIFRGPLLPFNEDFNINQLFVEKPLFELEVKHNNPIFNNSDSILNFKVKNLGQKFLENPTLKNKSVISVELKSNSFEFHESNNFQIPAQIGITVPKAFTPKSTGKVRIITINSSISGENKEPLSFSSPHTQTVKIEVLPEVLIFGLSEKKLKGIQIISGSIGIPSLILLLITYLMNRKKSKKTDENKSRIILSD